MTVIAGWDLFEDLREAQDEMLRANWLRAQRLGQYYESGNDKAAWAPAVDIAETKDAYMVSAELPGVSTDDLDITFQDGLMTIQGERYNRHNSSEEKVHRVEHRYGAFHRSFTLPSHVVADAIEASVRDGVLQILLPKAPEVHAKRIQVHASQKPAELTPQAEDQTTS
jgi:HSP20 family protein